MYVYVYVYIYIYINENYWPGGTMTRGTCGATCSTPSTGGTMTRGTCGATCSTPSTCGTTGVVSVASGSAPAHKDGELKGKTIGGMLIQMKLRLLEVTTCLIQMCAVWGIPKQIICLPDVSLPSWGGGHVLLAEAVVTNL